MTYLGDATSLGKFPSQPSGGASNILTLDPLANRGGSVLKNRINLIASHMFKQQKEHEEAMRHTDIVFNELLDHLDELVTYFREAFSSRNIPSSRIYAEKDPDRSIGILNILWHSMSFTARGNTKPLALYRHGREPIFTGRILALRGDFQDVSSQLQDQDYPDILQYEIASLYVPADKTSPAVMRIRHLGEKEQFFHQSDAAQMFLLKTIEMICGGGFFHEQDE